MTNFTSFLSLEVRTSFSLCRCVFLHLRTRPQGYLHRWHWWSGCRRRSLKMWRTCGTWRQGPQGRVERVHCCWLPRCCCCFVGLWVRWQTLSSVQICCYIASHLCSTSDVHTWQWGHQHFVFSSRTEEDIQSLLVRVVNQLHLVQHVHIHLHRRDAANGSCQKSGW